MEYCKKDNFVWTSDSANTLGVVFTNNITRMHDLNLTPKIDAFCHCLQNWKKWNLSLIGKINVLKTFALPKLIYPLTVLHKPNIDIIKNIEKLMFDFLWNGKPDKISRNTIIQDYKNAGLKMVDIHSFIDGLKISWIKRLENDKANNWQHIYEQELANYGGKLFFKCNMTEKDVKLLKINQNSSKT